MIRVSRVLVVVERRGWLGMRNGRVGLFFLSCVSCGINVCLQVSSDETSEEIKTKVDVNQEKNLQFVYVM